MNNIGIYKIKNIINGSLYIGSSVNLKKRFKDHLRLLKQNKHHSIKMQNSWNKYGEDNFVFEILEYCKKDELLVKEQFFLDTYKPNLNICKVAGNKLGVKMSDKQKKILSEINKGKKLSDETKQKISLGNIGKSKNKGVLKSDETKQKISMSCSGKTFSEETKIKLSNKRKLRVITEETKLKISKSHNGKIISEKTKLKMSESAKKRKRKPHSEETKQKIREARLNNINNNNKY